MTFLYPPLSVSLAGGATSANQVLELAELVAIEADTTTIAEDTTSIDAKTPALGAAATVASVPVNIASDQTVPVSAAALPLPTGASTSANQTTANNSLSSIDGKITACNTGAVVISSGNVTVNALAPVDYLDAVLIDAAGTPITASSGNPLQVIASTAAAVKKIEINDTTGYLIGLYTGVALSEVLHTILPLGGGNVDVNLPSGTRVSLRALENSAIVVGQITFNCLG